jgi:hypothetical protein
MSTTKKRLNITLPEQLDRVLARIAKRDAVPQATKATQLLALALEIEEDVVLGVLAQERDTKSVKFVDHADVWNIQ